MDKQDLKEIGEEVGKVIEQNIMPALDELHEKMDKMESRMGGMESRMGGMESRMGGMESRMDRMESQMVTKTYLDDKLADLEGTAVVRQRKEDQKVNLLIEMLREKEVINENDVSMLKEFQIFPS